MTTAETEPFPLDDRLPGDWMDDVSRSAVETVLTTTRAVRKRLDLDREVPWSVVHRCLRLAFQAPTGTNSQDWGWVVISDPGLKREIGVQYRAGMQMLGEAMGTGMRPSASGYEMYGGRLAPEGEEPIIGMLDEGTGTLAARLHEVPYLVIPVARSRFTGSGYTKAFQDGSQWGSVVQAGWSFMLALRSRGLGSVWTTAHLMRAREVGELLGIPAEFDQVGMFPVAYTKGTDFKPADRSHSEQTIYRDRWGVNP